MPATSDAGLVRAIGTRQLTASIVNVTIGAGIFVLPAVASARLGAAAPIAYVVCAALMALIVCCFAAAGSRVSLTGGVYAYVETAFGPFVGYLAGVLYGLMATFAVASVSSAFAGSVGALWPAPLAAGARRADRRAVRVARDRQRARRQTGRPRRRGDDDREAVAAARPRRRRDVARRSRQPALAGHAGNLAAIGQTAIVLIFAFVGLEIALVPSGEVRDPARTVPRALFSALAITTTLYLLIQTVAQGLLGPSMATYRRAPLAEAAGRALGQAAALLVLGRCDRLDVRLCVGRHARQPASLFAFARAGVLPAAVARVHPRFHTPYIAIVVYACIVATRLDQQQLHAARGARERRRR